MVVIYLHFHYFPSNLRNFSAYDISLGIVPLVQLFSLLSDLYFCCFFLLSGKTSRVWDRAACQLGDGSIGKIVLEMIKKERNLFTVYLQTAFSLVSKHICPPILYKHKYSGANWKVYDHCFMKQKCQVQMVIA